MINHFLVKQDFEKLLNVNIHGAGESTTDLSTGIISGSTPGDVLWCKKLDSLITVFSLGADWCIAIQFTHNHKEIHYPKRVYTL